MGMKRPTVGLSADVVARAVELRKAGRTMREIAAEVGASRAAIGEHFKKHPELAAGAGARGEAADAVEFAGDLDELAASALLTGRAAIAQVATRVATGVATAGDAAQLTGIVERATKLAQLLRGRATSRPSRLDAGTEQLTPAERRVMEALEEEPDDLDERPAPPTAGTP